MALLFMDGFEQYKQTSDLNASTHSSEIGTPGRWHQTGINSSISHSDVSLSNSIFRTTQPGGVSKSLITHGNPGANAWAFARLAIPTSAELYVGFNIYMENPPASSRNFFRLTDSSNNNPTGISTGLILARNSDGSVSVNRASGGTIFTTTPNTLIAATWYYIELHAVFGTTTGSVEMRIEGVTVGSATDVDTAGNISGTGYDYVYYTAELINRLYWDDIYICDASGSTNNSFLNPVNVFTLFPNANGSTNDMTPVGAATNWEAVQDTTWDTTTYVQTDVTNHIDYYNLQNLTTSPSSIYGVIVGSLYTKGNHPLRKMRNKAKLGPNVVDGVTSDEGVYLNYRRIADLLETKPGGGAWTEADVNNLEIGVESL